MKIMRITAAVLSVALLLSFGACKKNPEDESTAAPVTEETTAAPTLSEMSPDTIELSIPEIPHDFNKIDFSAGTEITKEQARADYDSSKIIKIGDTEYYYLTSGEFCMLTETEDGDAYFVYYNKDGIAESFGDDTRWFYFDTDGNVKYCSYSYPIKMPGLPDREVVTNYTPAGEKMCIAYDNIYYDADLNFISAKEYYALLGIDLPDSETTEAETE